MQVCDTTIEFKSNAPLISIDGVAIDSDGIKELKVEQARENAKK